MDWEANPLCFTMTTSVRYSDMIRSSLKARCQSIEMPRRASNASKNFRSTNGRLDLAFVVAIAMAIACDVVAVIVFLLCTLEL